MATSTTTSDEDADAAKSQPKRADDFVERMFSGIGHLAPVPIAQTKPPSEEPYRPLRQVTAEAGVIYRLQSPTSALRVQASSPASDVMTDLSRVAAVTTTASATVDDAHEAMIKHGVRALFVVNEARAVLGIITANDILGERPVQVAQNRGMRHAEVLVSHVMTAADSLEVMELQDVLKVRVGDVVETLKRSGRQHALVIERGSAEAASPTWTVRGIFSLTQIARQLGLQPQPGYSIGLTFAEIEAAIGA